MKLKLSMLLGLLMIASLVLTACGGAAPTEAPATEAPATEAPTEAPATEAPTEAPAAEPAGTLRIWADDTRAPVLQEPAAGTTTRRQRSVRVWVSAGPRLANVPGVVGESDRTAQLRLREDGFEIGPVAEIRTGGTPAGAVVAQEPPPSAPGTRVALLVNRGGQAMTYVMPDLIGVDGERAAELLRRRGFRVALAGTQPYPGVPAGVVLRQTPAGGFQIAPGEAIALEVSR